MYSPTLFVFLERERERTSGCCKMCPLDGSVSVVTTAMNPFILRNVRVLSKMVFLFWAVVSDHGLVLYVTGVAGALA